MTLRIQCSISAWLSDGSGGFRAVPGLRDFAIRTLFSSVA
jgi:hypothetical protein